MSRINLVYASSGRLDQSDAAKSFRQTRVAGFWFVNQQVVQVDAFEEPAGIRDEQMVGKELHMDSVQPGVVAVQDGVVDGLPKSLWRVVRYWDAEEPFLHLFLVVSRLEACFDRFQGLQ